MIAIINIAAACHNQSFLALRVGNELELELSTQQYIPYHFQVVASHHGGEG
jgi:hypothetical protein